MVVGRLSGCVLMRQKRARIKIYVGYTYKKSKQFPCHRALGALRIDVDRLHKKTEFAAFSRNCTTIER